MPRPANLTPAATPARRAFALLVTIVLVAFIVLILVGLASFTRVETQVAGNAQQLAAARQNALLGLNVALGQLQRHAGPDQRITARADLVAGKANPLYTGVWDTTAAGLLNPAAPAVWLVSGNENPSAPLAINPDTNLASDPNAVVLVGVNTAGPENPGPADSNHVRVRRQTIDAESIPGIAGPQTVGAYAYWIGDEGVKARLNLDAPGLSPTATSESAALAFASAPRAAVELMERSPSPAPGVVTSPWGALFPFSPDTTDAILSVEQLPFYAPTDATAARNATRARYHDLTTLSTSVLADTSAGGLRQDLTRVLSTTNGPANADFIFPVEGSAASRPHQNPPTWGRLRDWWQSPVIPASGSLVPSLGTATAPPIAPALLWAELGVSFFYEELPGGTYRLRFQGFPRLVLWNPYTAVLEGATYEFGISSTNNSNTVRIQRTDGSFVRLFTFTGYRFSQNNSFAAPPVGQGQAQYLRFRVIVPDLEPGQAKVFSLNSSSDGALFSQNTTTLEEGDFPARHTLFSGNFDTTLTPPFEAIAFADHTSSNNNPNGGEYMFYLRRGGLADNPGVPNSSAPPTQTKLFAPGIGFSAGLFGGSPTLALANTPEIQPQIRLLAHARLGNAHPAHPQRWLANANPIAPFQLRHGADGNSQPSYTAGFFAAGSTTLNTSPDDEVSVGTNFELPPAGGAPIRLILREPRLPDPGLYQSIAQLQHAPLSDTGIGPLNAVGNSLQNPRINTRTATVRTTGGNALANPLYDSSHRLNAALWDRYFFSTVPAAINAADLSSPAFSLPNARLTPRSASGGAPSAADLLDHRAAAANILLKGGFNINSTSEQAWRALLAAAHNLAYDPNSGTLSPTAPLSIPFSRFLRPPGDSTDPWSGYRELTETQLAALAANIVAEVRARGPFKSLADFVNRRLADDATGLKGALQAAIDATDLNPAATRRLNDRAPYNQHPVGVGPGGGASLDLAAYRGTADAVARLPVSSRNAFGPGYLTQADVLARIGSTLSARSDTFVIRVYGETRNPIVGDEPVARAWAEAVVQRMPEYVEDSTPPQNTPTAGSDSERFGRRFTVVSFRWLGPEDI